MIIMYNDNYMIHIRCTKGTPVCIKYMRLNLSTEGIFIYIFIN